MAKDDVDQDDQEEVVPADLDTVHDISTSEVEAEDAEEDEIEDEETDDSDDEESDDVDDEEQEPDEPKAPDVAPAPKPAEPPEETTVKVKSFDGKTHEFASLDDVPEDFEPASYKEWGRAVRDFTEKDAQDKQARVEAQAAEAQQERDGRVKTIQDSWDKDVESLTRYKVLPTDPKEREQEIEAVFSLMENELKQGKVIDSFAHAHEIYEYRKDNDQRVEDTKAHNDEKKRRGGMVQGGSGALPTKPSSGSRTIEAPPQGVTLDQVHAVATENL